MSRQLEGKQNTLPWTQSNFSRGLIKNAPHDDLPDFSVAGITNAHCFDTEIQPRLASWLYSELQPPAWRDPCDTAKTGYQLSQDLDIVTLENYPTVEFSAADVSNYIVWPDDVPFHDEISEFISVTQVRVTSSDTRNPTNGCWIHGRLNLNSFHKRKRRRIWQWGKEVYTSDLAISAWTRCLCVSRYRPNNTISDRDEMDDYEMIGNSRGIYKLSFDEATSFLWQTNSPVPSVLLEGNIRRRGYDKRFDYVYSMSRLAGVGLRDRTTDKILQESGTTALNVDVVPNRDYATFWTEWPIGPGTVTGGRLQCGRLSDAYSNAEYWRVTVPFPGASFGFTANERTENFLMDTTITGYNVQDMDELAAAFQITTRTAFPWVTCKWNAARYFVFTSGEEAGSTLGYLTAGVGGVDVSGIINGIDGEATSLDNAWNYTVPLRTGIYYIPEIGGIPEWHWTHYTKYRSTDTGPEGAVPLSNGVDLPPQKLTWCGDTRIAGAFYASKTNGLVTAQIGTFEKADEGTPLRWEDGDVETISLYISPTQVRVGPDYYGADKPLQACAIGGGDVFRASQEGNIVTNETVLNDNVFNGSTDSCDERKTITWSTGYYSVVIEVLSASQYRVHDSAVRATQGMTMNPVSRVITDITTDETLRNRMDEKHIGLLNHRFYVAMPSCNILTTVPGFLLTARRTDSNMHYCQLANNRKYLAGYYLEGRQQMDKIEGSIQIIKKAPNYFLVWCNDSLWGGPTNNPDVKKLPEYGEEYAVLHADVLDEDIGAVDWGSVQEIDFGTFELICQDMGWRQLKNRVYTEDFAIDQTTAQDRISRDLKTCWNLGSSAYGRVLGHVWWGTLR